MNYNKQEIKRGITLHQINTNNFKTNLYAIFLATPITRENVTKDAVISAVLRRGTNNIKSQELISQELESMYGASFDCGIEKTGDNHVFKFYLESLSDEFLPAKEDLSKKSIEILLDIVFNPLIENGGFKAEYVEGEKNNIKQIIEKNILCYRLYIIKERFDEAECILLETFNIAKTNGLNKKAAEIAIFIGKYYIGFKREVEAARYLDEGVSIFRNLGILNN